MVLVTKSMAESAAGQWQWRRWQGLSYLTCDLLEGWAHGFFTREFAPRSPEELTALLAPGARPLRVKQVHGDRVLRSGEIHGGAVLAEASTGASEQSTYPQADGTIADGTDQVAWVCTADCTPALIGDRRTGRVAAVHAGWRGTAAAVVPKAIARFQELGSQLEDVVVALGPAISGDRYQVAQPVAAQTLAALDLDLDVAAALAEPPILPDSEPGKCRLDVRRVNVLQLERLGIGRDRIAVAPHCTHSDPDRFFSYRRDGTKTVQWSGIASAIA